MTAQLRQWCDSCRSDGVARFSAGTSAVLGRALALAREHLGMELAWLSHTEGQHQVVQLVDGDSTHFPVQEGYRSAALSALGARLLDGRLPAVATDARRSDPASAAELNLGSYAGVAVTQPGGRTYGLLCCASRHPTTSLHPRDAYTMRLFAAMLADTLGEYQARHGIQEAFLRNAEAMLAAGGMRMAMQPIVDLTTRRPLAVEALARFPTAPYTTEGWFREARRAGAGVQLELDAMSEGLRLLPSVAFGQRLSLNASPSLVASAELTDLLADQPGERLMIEITEHNLAENIAAVLDSVKRLQGRGTWIAIDDAGTGYSSLHQILQLGPDVIKLDRALVSDVDTDAMKRALASAFVTFTGAAGKLLVAEGVETRSELRTLQALGVRYGQGYHLARPVYAPARAAQET